MVSRYVATTKSLASADGFDVQEVRLETEEAKRVRLMQEKAAQRPLYDQLMEHQTKKQEEYDANARLLNAAPPKALDEDDAAFLNDEEQRKVDRLRRKKEIENDALDAFRLAQTQTGSGSAVGDRSGGGGGGVVLSVAKVKDAASSSGDAALNKQLPIIKIIKRKKADIDGDDDSHLLNGKKREIETSNNCNSTTRNINNNNSTSNSNSNSNSNDNIDSNSNSNGSHKLQSLLGDYGSDSD